MSFTKDVAPIVSQKRAGCHHPGDPADLPLPEFPTSWKYGQPDLVIAMPEPFFVPADSSVDVARKFVIHVPINETKCVRAVDFNPGIQRAVHHLRLRVNLASLSCKLGRPADAAD